MIGHDFWAQRTFSEKLGISAAAMACLIAFLYHGLWVPLNDEVHRLHMQNQQDEQLLAWMSQHKDRLVDNKPKVSKGPLFVVVQQAFTNPKLNAIPRIDKVGDGEVSVMFDSVGFDNFMRQLETMVAQYGFEISQFSAVSLEEPGLVKVQCRIKKVS